MLDIVIVVDIMEGVDTVDIVDILQLCAAVVQPSTAVMQPRADIM